MANKKLSYGEQLAHPNWQRKRLEVLEAADWQCESCGAKESMLHVHHKQYFKGRMAWEYGGPELVALCEDCHAKEHEALDALRRLLAGINTSDALSLVAGFNFHADWIDGDEKTSAKKSNRLAFAAGFLAYIANGLDIDDMLKVARFAASLHNEGAEPRLWFEHSRGDIFGETAGGE